MGTPSKPTEVTMTEVEFDDAIRAAKEAVWNELAKEVGATDLPNPYVPAVVLAASEKITRVSARKKILAEVLWLSASNAIHGYLTTETTSLCGINRPTTNMLSLSTDFTVIVDYCESCFDAYNKLIQKQGGGTARSAEVHAIYV